MPSWWMRVVYVLKAKMSPRLSVHRGVGRFCPSTPEAVSVEGVSRVGLRVGLAREARARLATCRRLLPLQCAPRDKRRDDIPALVAVIREHVVLGLLAHRQRRRERQQPSPRPLQRLGPDRAGVGSHGAWAQALDTASRNAHAANTSIPAEAVRRRTRPVPRHSVATGEGALSQTPSRKRAC